jgi:hypothetical protein
MKVYKRLWVLIALGLLVSMPRRAAAHCDTVDGPVVKAAKLALSTGDIAPVLKWVRPKDEAQIRTAFQHTLQVRALSPQARELADNYFFETLVRAHRAGEGEPYTGLKPAGTPVEPGIALADKAVERGSAEELIQQVTAEVAVGIRRRFSKVEAASRQADASVVAGRAYVAAYVEFIHFVEQLEQSATALEPSHAEQSSVSGERAAGNSIEQK